MTVGSSPAAPLMLECPPDILPEEPERRQEYAKWLCYDVFDGVFAGVSSLGRQLPLYVGGAGESPAFPERPVDSNSRPDALSAVARTFSEERGDPFLRWLVEETTPPGTGRVESETRGTASGAVTTTRQYTFFADEEYASLCAGISRIAPDGLPETQRAHLLSSAIGLLLAVSNTVVVDLRLFLPDGASATSIAEAINTPESFATELFNAVVPFAAAHASSRIFGSHGVLSALPAPVGVCVLRRSTDDAPPVYLVVNLSRDSQEVVLPLNGDESVEHNTFRELITGDTVLAPGERVGEAGLEVGGHESLWLTGLP